MWSSILLHLVGDKIIYAGEESNSPGSQMRYAQKLPHLLLFVILMGDINSGISSSSIVSFADDTMNLYNYFFHIIP